MYYLRKKCKHGTESQKRVTTTDSYFIQWVDQIHNVWEKSKKNNNFITPDHKVAQYIRGYKILCYNPWDKVDFFTFLSMFMRNFTGLWLYSPYTVGAFMFLIP